MTGDDALQRPVSINKRAKPFGELTLQEVRDRAAELSAATGWGPTARVAPVARAWAELAERMQAAQASLVAEVGEEATALAERLWVVPPGGSLL